MQNGRSRNNFEVVSHNGRMYVIGGDSSGGSTHIGDVWSSADGKNWVQEKEDTDTYWSKRSLHLAMSHNGLLYVVGGRYKEGVLVVILMLVMCGPQGMARAGR